jgi:hypothetical protein
MQKQAIGWLCAAAIILSACSSTRLVKPLDEDQQALSLGAGGPIIKFSGMNIPMPLSNICYARGFKNELTGFASIHTTSLLYGLGQFEAGVVKGICKNDGWKPGLSVAPSVQLMLDHWEWNFRMYPQLDANAYWTYGKRSNLVYAGMNNFFELKGTRNDGQKQPNAWLPGFQLGHTFVRPKSNYQLELKYLAATVPNKNTVVDYVVPSGMANGAFGFYITWQYKF